ncbi:aminoacyl--tRNA ligase-related protein [Staphylococcus aureus]|nr:aminoacyl--tRNA ligase-related protein [Staphylococcus aureus]
MKKIIDDEGIVCPVSKTANWTEIRQFNLMFKTFQGVTEDSTNEIFLRPETAQGIFVNYKNVQRSMRKKLPFGIGQIGKSFRNEITPGNFIFRTREFEQMELEFFCKPGEEIEWQNYWKTFASDWLTSLNMSSENMRLRDHDEDELSHYSNATTDIEYKFPFGWVSYGVSQVVQTSTYVNMLNTLVKISDTTIQKRTKNIFHIVSSHHLVQIV